MTTTIIATAEELRRQVQQAETALSTIQGSRADRNARINRLEEERCDILVAARLDGKNQLSPRAEALSKEVAALRKANSEDAVLEPRIAATLQRKSRQLKAVERADNCAEFIKRLDRYENETVSRFAKLTLALNDELAKCRERDREMEQLAVEFDLKDELRGTKFGQPISERRGEMVSAILSQFVPTPFSRAFLDMVRDEKGPLFIGNLIRQVREAVAALQAEAIQAAESVL